MCEKAIWLLEPFQQCKIFLILRVELGIFVLVAQ